MKDLWKKVDDHFAEKFQQDDEVMKNVLEANEEAGLPKIDVSPNQGRFLSLLAKLANARTILEIGTLGGYSTIWFGRALPDDGRLITLEFNPKHAEVARKNIDMAGLSPKIEVIEGAALDTLPTLKDRGFAEFDLIFIDADKDAYPDYFKWAMAYAKPGTIIIGDNVVRGGRVLDADDEMGTAVRTFTDLMADDPRIDATVLQTVGGKGYDGFAIGVVN
ncbi:class I SAM-dependent methyltransferase [Indiicoccus explosivorum]|uniref:class I SAM-dependent methyltransferase n=1 Tax=Indiicoccus explosivorum TaxID=1917864 RepID=UPI000B42EA1F